MAGDQTVRTRPLLNLILHDDALSRGLEEAEARVLVEWLADWAERYAGAATEESDALARIERLRRRGRAIRQFVTLWCHEHDEAAAIQLASSERFTWPLPESDADPWELMQDIVQWEERELGERRGVSLARVAA